MLQCIAVDDEPLALNLLEDNISKVPYLNLVAKCSDAFEATKALEENKIDLVFIDIQMPGLTGLQFIASLSLKPMVIIITAYKQFALDSYELDVVDYLVKPVPLDRFMKSCNKAKALYELKAAKKDATLQAPSEFFFINVDYSMVKLQFEDIMWVEGLRDYIKIYLTPPAKPLVVRMNMKTIEEELPATMFIRIHKSYIVAIKSISAVRKNSVFIKDMELPVGETYRDAITQLTGKNTL
jgi:two-component system LytT family response regulator